MQAVCYRKEIEGTGSPLVRESEGDLVPLSPGLFYPQCGQEEMAMWTHWLPTMYTFVAGATYAIKRKLQDLKAPREIMEEFAWASNMRMFEEYAIRTPVRQDGRDPLLLARAGDVWYRVALWGESILLSLKEICSLVQESLTIKSRVAKWQKWFCWGGTGLALLVALGGLLWEIQPSGSGFILMLVILSVVWLPGRIYTPENAQHDFLDRYRR